MCLFNLLKVGIELNSVCTSFRLGSFASKQLWPRREKKMCTNDPLNKHTFDIDNSDRLDLAVSFNTETWLVVSLCACLLPTATLFRSLSFSLSLWFHLIIHLGSVHGYVRQAKWQNPIKMANIINKQHCSDFWLFRLKQPSKNAKAKANTNARVEKAHAK